MYALVLHTTFTCDIYTHLRATIKAAKKSLFTYADEIFGDVNFREFHSSLSATREVVLSFPGKSNP